MLEWKPIKFRENHYELVLNKDIKIIIIKLSENRFRIFNEDIDVLFSGNMESAQSEAESILKLNCLNKIFILQEIVKELDKK